MYQYYAYLEEGLEVDTLEPVRLGFKLKSEQAAFSRDCIDTGEYFLWNLTTPDEPALADSSFVTLHRLEEIDE